KILVSGDTNLPPGQFEVESSRKVHEAEVLKPGRVSGLYDDEEASLEAADYGAHPASNGLDGPLPGSDYPGDEDNGPRHPGEHPARHGPKSGEAKKDNQRGRRPFKGRGRQNGPKDSEANRDGAFV
ncbi:MAG: hypothetical protein LBE80_03600, partial [Deltaproteobacteria bacterium]|nr:hypothetical protein [Deltaproteobacteria bacterium]